MVLISIVIPAYNAETTIEKCIHSVLMQTYQNLEVIIVNDGSVDSTEDICRAIMQKEGRIKVYAQVNKGVSAARNKGIEEAMGDYIMFVDADDFIEENMVKILYQMYEMDASNDLTICSYDERVGDRVTYPFIDCRREISQIEFMRNLFDPHSIKGFLVNKLFRVSIINKYNIRLNEQIFICEDLLFCCEYGLHIRQAGFSEQRLYHYVLESGSATRSAYSERRFTSVYAFERMQGITKVLEDQSLNDYLNAHFIVICIQLYKRLLKKYKKLTSDEMIKIYSVIKGMNMRFLKSNWQLKFKIAYLPLKYISYMIGK